MVTFEVDSSNSKDRTLIFLTGIVFLWPSCPFSNNFLKIPKFYFTEISDYFYINQVISFWTITQSIELAHMYSFLNKHQFKGKWTAFKPKICRKQAVFGLKRNLRKWPLTSNSLFRNPIHAHSKPQVRLCCSHK